MTSRLRLNPYMTQWDTTCIKRIHTRWNYLFVGGVTDLSHKERKRLELDQVGLFSATNAVDAEIMSTLISKLPRLSLATLGRRPEITDGCACCGGNVISFVYCSRFQNVNAVEVDTERTNILRKNIVTVSQMRPTNTDVNVYSGSYIDHMPNLKQDVVFLDAPWGGRNYINQHSVSLYIDKWHISSVVAYLFNNSKHNNTKYVVLKVPPNWNIIEMQDMLCRIDDAFSENNIILMYKFKKFSMYQIEIPLIPETWSCTVD
jgi:predicted RNA methylase